MLRDGGGWHAAGAGEAAQGRTQLGVLVCDQPGIHGSRRLGAWTAVDGHRRIAAADQQPGRANRGEFIAPTPSSVSRTLCVAARLDAGSGLTVTEPGSGPWRPGLGCAMARR
jgi:hypothetical protein